MRKLAGLRQHGLESNSFGVTCVEQFEPAEICEAPLRIVTASPDIAASGDGTADIHAVVLLQFHWREHRARGMSVSCLVTTDVVVHLVFEEMEFQVFAATAREHRAAREVYAVFRSHKSVGTSLVGVAIVAQNLFHSRWVR